MSEQRSIAARVAHSQGTESADTFTNSQPPIYSHSPPQRHASSISVHERSRPVDPTTQLIYSRTPHATIEQHVRQALHDHILRHDNSGATTADVVTRHDLKCAIILLLGYTPSHVELSALLPAGAPLTVDGCVALLARRVQQSDTLQYFQQLFAAFDVDDRGFIRRDDFLRVCERVVVGGAEGGREVLGQLFDVCDGDDDGLVSYREFDRLMSGRPFAAIG